VMDEAILAHRRKLSREINNLKSSNSQEFWKLLKKELNNILHKFSSKELIFNLSTDELASVIFKFVHVTS
jgi:ERCC4-type nuclease